AGSGTTDFGFRLLPTIPATDANFRSSHSTWLNVTVAASTPAERATKSATARLGPLPGVTMSVPTCVCSSLLSGCWGCSCWSSDARTQVDPEIRFTPFDQAINAASQNARPRISADRYIPLRILIRLPPFTFKTLLHSL